MTNDYAGASTPSRIPTSSVLSCIDPLREPLRDRALDDFKQSRFREYREAAAAMFPRWRKSPTGCYLFAISWVYEAEKRRVGQRADYLLAAEELLAESRLAWDGVLEGVDLIERDSTLIHTSLDLVNAWILRLRGKAAAGRKLVLARLEELRNSKSSRSTDDADLFHCPFQYLLIFASDDQAPEQVQAALALADECTPGWERDAAFVGHVLLDPRQAFVQKHPVWIHKVARAQPETPQPERTVGAWKLPTGATAAIV